MKVHLVRFGIACVVAVVGFVVLAVLGSLLAARPIPLFNGVAADVAEARIITRVISPEIDLEQTLRANNRQVEVSGRIQCDLGERLIINVVFRQELPTAVVDGEGQTKSLCTGEIQSWTVLASAQKSTGYVEGIAFVCAVATTRVQGTVTDTFAWCKQVTLVRG
jgi:hypothetical protein